MRKQIGEGKIEQKKSWNCTAYELQEIADFLNAEIRGKGKEYTGGLPFNYVFFSADGREWFKVKLYRHPKSIAPKLYSKLIMDYEERYLVSGEPMLDREGNQIYMRKPIGIEEDEILTFLKAEDIINLVKKWREEAAEKKLIPDPSDKRDMPSNMKKQVWYWCNKEGIDENKYLLKPMDINKHPDVLAEEVNKFESRKQLREEIQKNRNRIYGSY
jgi:hypothetical protein